MRFLMSVLSIALLTTLFATLAPEAISGGDKKEEKKEKAKDPLEGKKGTAIGKVVAKGDNFIEVLGDGEEKARKFVPEWRGGQPSAGGGLDKAILKQFASTKIGSRVEIEWVFHERLRALELKVLREPTEKKE